MLTIPHFYSNFAPPAVAAGLKLRLTCTAYRPKEIPNEARGDVGLHRDASGFL